jgi:cyclohexanone monooxygenase
MHARGFPNCYFMTNAQAGFTASYPHLLDEQAKHLAYIIQKGKEQGVERIEVTEEAESAWVQQCIDKARNAGDFLENCTPGYYNNEGKTGELSAQNGFYGGGSIEFFAILEHWRSAGKLEGMEVE